MLRRILIGLCVTAAAFVLAAYALPRQVHVERSIVVKAPAATVYRYVSGFRRFNDFSPWAEQDPQARYTLSGPARGVGARLEWAGDPKTVGKGSQEIIAAEPGRSVRIALDFGPDGTATSLWSLGAHPEGTQVTWGFDTDLGLNPLSRWFGLALDRFVGADYEKGLGRLEALVEREVAEGAPRIATSPDGVHIEYRVYGRGEPALVFIHGWSCDAGYWAEQVEHFRARHTVMTVNLAGHGASGGNRSTWSIENYGADVAAAAREIPNAKLVLIGHSMGGPVALAAAGALRERLLGIVGIDTFQMIGAPPPSFGDLLARMKADFPATTREFVAGNFFTKNTDPELVRRIAHDMSLAPPQVAIPSIESLLALDYAPLLAQITVPIVAINAAPTDGARVRGLAPTFRLIQVEGLGHFLMMEDPPRVNALLEGEIRRMLTP